MVNPGSFHGARKEFLLGEKTAYAAGVVGGYAGDALALIQRRYFKRFPVDLPHENEPSAEDLAAVDDDSPEEEHRLPDRETAGVEEYEVAVRALEERSKLVKFRKAQIKRWLAYQYMKDNDVDPKDSGAQNPYRALLFKLTGVGITRPRAKSAVNVWRKSQKTIIDEEVSRRIAAAPGSTNRKNMAAIRDKVARDLFSVLADEEKEEWVERAKEEHEAAIACWTRDTEGPASKEPEDRQRCIQGLVQFAQPILDAICEATGWAATLVAGGPEPADGGRLNIVSVHSGTTCGDIKMNFGRADRLRFKKFWVPMYGQFLQKCYTIEECRSRALPTEEGHLGLAGLDVWNEDGATFDSIPPVPSTASSSSRTPALFAPDASAQGPWTQATEPQRTSAPHSMSRSLSPVHPVVSSTSPRAPGSSPLLHQSHRSLSPMHSPAPSPPRSPAPSPPRSPAPSPPRSPAPSPPRSPASSPRHSPAPPAPSPRHSQAQSPRLSQAWSPRLSSTASARHSPAASPARVQSNPPMRRSRASVSQVAPNNDHHDAVSLNTTGDSVARPATAPRGRRNKATEALSVATAPKTSTKRKHSQVGTQEHEDQQLGRGGRRTRARAGVGSSAVVPPPSKRLRASDRIEGPAKPAGSRPKPRPQKFATQSGTALHSGHSNNARSTGAQVTEHPGSLASQVIEPSGASASQVIEHPGAPKWFTSAYAMLNDDSLGLHWCELVRMWGAFEKQEGYRHIARLKTAHRPSVVADWIRRARPDSWRPEINNITAYEEDMREWWTSLQPAWRVSDGAVQLDTLDGDWESLRCSGINGIMGVLAALFYWGLHVKANDGDEGLWLEFTKDCSAAISHLVV